MYFPWKVAVAEKSSNTEGGLVLKIKSELLIWCNKTS